MDNERETLIRTRAYEIWEREGCPEGKAADHWLQAEAEATSQSSDERQLGADENSSEDEGLRAAREYERGVRQFEGSGQADAKAQEAKRAIAGPEGAALKAAEQIGKRRGRGEDLSGNR